MKPTPSVFMVLVLLLLGTARSQDVDLYEWTVNLEGVASVPMGLDTDPDDNVVVTGYFDHSPSIQSLAVAKFKPDGTLIWQRGSSQTRLAKGSFVVSDRTGNIYVAGLFGDTLILDGRQFISKSWSDVFLIKYDPEGKLAWATVFQGRDNGIKLAGLAVGGDNHPVLLGSTGDTVVIGADTLMPPVGSLPLKFLTKVSPSGEVQWTIHSEPTRGYFHIGDVVSKSDGNLVLSGYVSGLRRFGGVSIGKDGEDSADGMPFIMQVSEKGQVAWVRQFPGIRQCQTRGIELDSAENIYFSGNINRKDYIIDNDTVRSPTGSSLLVIKTDSSGRLIWHRNIVKSGNMWVNSLSAVSDGSVYMKAQFATQSPQELFHVYSLDSKNKTSELIAKFDSLGKFVWYTVIPTNHSPGTDIGNGGLSRDRAGNVYSLGRFYGKRILNSKTFDQDKSQMFVTKIGKNRQGGILERFSSSWKQIDPKVDATLFSVSYLKDKFYAGGSGLILSSPDGSGWKVDKDLSCFVFAMAYDNKESFLAGGTNGILLNSNDGSSWQGGFGHTPVASIYDMQWVGDRFWAAGESGNIMNSIDGSEWKSSNWQPGYVFHSMAFSDRIAVAVGTNGMIFASENRTTWTQQVSGTTKNIYGIAWNGTNFVAVGEVVLTSPDGKTWTPQPKAIASPLQEFLDVKNVGGHFLAVGYNGRISTSKSGYEWKDYYYPCDCGLMDIATNDSLAMIVGDHGKFLVSPLKDILPVAARRPIGSGPRFQILKAGGSGINVRFHLEKGSDIRLTAYDLFGRKVATFFEKQVGEGTHARSIPLAALNSGLYLLEFTSNRHRVVGKAQILR